MQPWNIVGGPREYTDYGGADIDVGWAWDIGRGAERRTIRVDVAGGRLRESDLPAECEAAISSQGRSALGTFLGDDDPPARIVITSGGLLAPGGGGAKHLQEFDEGGEG